MPSNPLRNITVSAPGFFGKNTQDSPLDLDSKFAAIANNAVIDQRGRLAARKGYTELPDNNATVLGSSTMDFVKAFEDEDGTTTIVSAGNNKIFTGVSTLSDVTPGGATITASKWQGVTLNDKHYLFQAGHKPIVYPAGGSFGLVEDQGGYVGTVPQGNCAVAGYGRLFVSGVSGSESIVYWSDLLDGLNWSGGSSGSIDIHDYWPRGWDKVIALHIHNNFLLIFGRFSTLIYEGVESPSTMVLKDVINGIGCIARDSVQTTGRDVLFLSHQGVRTLGRTIQEKSLPIADVSKNVEDELEEFISGVDATTINSMYNPEEKFYLLSFPANSVSYCFDIRRPLEDGSFRVTTWTGLVPNSQCRCVNEVHYLAMDAGLFKIDGYTDDGESYYFDWLLHPQTFGDNSRLKFVKHLHMSWEGGYGYTPILRWSFDYTNNFQSGVLEIETGGVTEYGVAEYGISEFTGNTLFGEDHINGGGSGRLITAGVKVLINGKPFALQEFNVQATIGRIV